MRWGKGRGRAGGGDNDLVCQHDQSSAPQRVRWGKGRGRAGGGGGDNDLVCQHDQSSAPQRVRRAEEGDDNVLVSRGQRDHIQSPAPQRVRGGRVKYPMLHIPGIRITCMFPCLCAQGSSIAEYLDFSRIAVKRDTCVLVCLYALRGFTRPSYISTW